MITLRPDQREALNKLKNGNILCGDVGSGKSFVCLFYYYEKVCGGSLNQTNPKVREKDIPLLIITTAKKRDSLDWQKECSRIGLPLDNIIVDSWNNISRYKDVKDSFVCFDEQRAIGSGKWSKQFVKIARNNHWIMLSATPGDSWEEFWAVFVANGFYKHKTEYLTSHAVYMRHSKYPKIERWIGVGKLLRLKQQILVPIHYKRHTVSHIEYVDCLFDKEKEELMVKQRWNPYEHKPIADAAELCRLLQRNTISDLTRQQSLFNIYRLHSRIIVFYNYNYELDILINFCQKNKITFAQWNGHKHQDVPEDICWIYLVQYSSGCEGWNCVSAFCTVYFSQSYSYKQTVQAAGRINRANTPFTDLYYYHFTSQSQIDKAIKKCLDRKENFNEQKYFGF